MVGNQVVHDLRRGYVVQVGMRVKQHQCAALRRWRLRPALWAVDPYIAPVSQGLRRKPVALQIAVRHTCALLAPWLGRRIGQLQHGAALVAIHRRRAVCSCAPGSRIAGVALQGGENAAPLLQRRGINIGHIGRKAVAQPHIAGHHKAGPPHVGRAQALQ
ncbi:hypothetical protein D3C72_1836960 [compost metagenome]